MNSTETLKLDVWMELWQRFRSGKIVGSTIPGIGFEEIILTNSGLRSISTCFAENFAETSLRGSHIGDISSGKV